MKFVRDEQGQMLIMSALSMLLLLGFAGFGTDMGLLFRAQRNMQIAADAAAVSAALDNKYNGSESSAETAGLAAAIQNGLAVTTNCTADNGSEVCVSCPPADGPNAGSSGFCEATVSQQNSTFFMGLFNHGSMTVAARAVAGAGVTKGCVWALGKSGVDVAMSGSASISVPDCNIYDDSDSSNALTLSGSASLTANEIGIVGGYSDSSSGKITPDPPTTGLAPAANPLPLSAPEIPTGTCSGSTCNPNYSSGSNTLGPGTYNSISVSGTGTTLTLTPGNYIINGNVSASGGGALILGAGNYTITGSLQSSGSSPMTLGSGLYIVEGQLSLSGSSTLTGTGVTFYTKSQVSISGSSAMDLTAPTSGPYDGVLIFKSTTDNSQVAISGSSNMILEGIIDTPASQVNFSGGTSSGIYADFIADSLDFSGSTSFNSYQSINSSALIGKIAMVE